MKRALILSINLLFVFLLLPIVPVSADSIARRPTPSLNIKTLPYYSYNTSTTIVSHEIKYLKKKYRKIRVDVADLTEYRAEKANIFVNLERKMVDGKFQSVGHFKVLGGNAKHVEFWREINYNPLIDQAIYRVRLTVKENLNAKMHGRYAIYQVDPIHASQPKTSQSVDHHKQVETKNNPQEIDIKQNVPNTILSTNLLLPFTYQFTKPQDEMIAPNPYQVLQPGEVIQVESKDTSTNPQLPSNAYILVELQRKTAGEWVAVGNIKVLKGDQAFIDTFKREQEDNLQDGEAYRVVLKPKNNANVPMTGQFNVKFIAGTREVVQTITEESYSPAKPTPPPTTKLPHSYILTYEEDINNAPYVLPGQPLQTLKQAQVIVLEANDASNQPSLPSNAYIQAELQRRTFFGWKTVGSTKIKKGQQHLKYIFRNEYDGDLLNGQAYRIVLKAKNNNNITMTGQYKVSFLIGQRKSIHSNSKQIFKPQPKKSLGQSVPRVSR